MNYREASGETVSDQSWVMRNIWDTKRGYMKGLITAPKKLKPSGVKRLMEDALWTQGLRKKLEVGKKRHEFQTDHGFRKWFKTRCELAGMKPANIEKLMDHSLGISDSYYRATESELLADYLKVVNYLTIGTDTILKAEVEQIKDLRSINEDAIATLSDQVLKLMAEVQQLKKQQI